MGKTASHLFPTPAAHGGVQYVDERLVQQPTQGGSRGEVADLPPSKLHLFQRGGSATPLGENVLSCPSREQEQTDKSATPAYLAIEDAKQRAYDAAEKRASGKSRSDGTAELVSIDEVAIEKSLLGDWLREEETAWLVSHFSIPYMEEWMRCCGVRLPESSAAKLGYVIAAFHSVRKTGVSWEKMIQVDGEGKWIGINDDILCAHIETFLKAAGMTAHLGSLSLSRKTITMCKKELDLLPWSQGHDAKSELHQWAMDYLSVDFERVGYAVSSRELFEAYRLTSKDRSLTARGFGMRLSKAIQDIYKEDYSKGRIYKTANLRRTTLMSHVDKCKGWLGLRLQLAGDNEHKLREVLQAAGY